MTPFGQRLREMRAERGLALKDMADGLGVTPTYLSALELGRRGRPSWSFVQRVIQYFNVIWDEAEELQRLADLSHPRVVIDTVALSADATLLANRLAQGIDELGADDLAALLAALDRVVESRRRMAELDHGGRGCDTPPDSSLDPGAPQ